MSEVLVYGHPLSQPYRTILIFCELSQVPYKTHELNFREGEHRSEYYTKINPFQEFPVIVHNDFSLWESPAIVSYLSEVFGTDNQWYPNDLKVRARINSYLHWHHANVREPILEYYRAKATYPYFYGKPKLTPEREEGYLRRMEIFFKDFEWLLSFTGFVAQTPELTIADVFAFNEIFNGQMIRINLQEHPIILEWYSKLSDIPEVKKITTDAQPWIDLVVTNTQ
jgi:glutathione S-transferase